MRTFDPDTWHDVAKAISAMIDDSWADESVYTEFNGTAHLVRVTIDLYVALAQDADLDAEQICDFIAFNHSHIIVRNYDSGAVDVTGYGTRHDSSTLPEVNRAWQNVVADMSESEEGSEDESEDESVGG